jgi:UDP-N-acetylmuramoylalanine--D-glutamate ligase
MIPLPFLKDRTVAVMGLGISGLSAVRALVASGANVCAWDDDEKKHEAARTAGAEIVDLRDCDWTRPVLLVWSPGIPHTWPKPHPVAEAARRAGRPMVSDVDILARACPEAIFVGITGTNGKSTTTSLIAHILSQAGRKIAVGGNLGTPALELEQLDASGVYVLEMSSYQLELSPAVAFGVSILLNVSPDHLSRHGGIEGYIAAKRRIFDHQAPPRAAIIGVDDAPCRAIHDRLVSSAGHMVMPISAERELKGGIHAETGTLFDDRPGEAGRIADLTPIATLPGRHNWQNACAAYAACRSLSLSVAEIVKGLGSYPGLAHRQELVAEINGVRYVNDSKATNADAAAKALDCYDEVYWIAGGLPKEGGIGALSPYFPRIRHAFLIGQAANDFAATLGEQVPYTLAGDLATAVAEARCMAESKGKKPVVLLSPACASWDQFKSFEERGDVFRSLVRKEAS